MGILLGFFSASIGFWFYGVVVLLGSMGLCQVLGFRVLGLRRGCRFRVYIQSSRL